MTTLLELAAGYPSIPAPKDSHSGALHILKIAILTLTSKDYLRTSPFDIGATIYSYSSSHLTLSLPTGLSFTLHSPLNLPPRIHTFLYTPPPNLPTPDVSLLPFHLRPTPGYTIPCQHTTERPSQLKPPSLNFLLTYQFNRGWITPALNPRLNTVLTIDLLNPPPQSDPRIPSKIPATNHALENLNQLAPATTALIPGWALEGQALRMLPTSIRDRILWEIAGILLCISMLLELENDPIGEIEGHIVGASLVEMAKFSGLGEGGWPEKRVVASRRVVFESGVVRFNRRDCILKRCFIFSLCGLGGKLVEALEFYEWAWRESASGRLRSKDCRCRDCMDIPV